MTSDTLAIFGVITIGLLAVVGLDVLGAHPIALLLAVIGCWFASFAGMIDLIRADPL